MHSPATCFVICMREPIPLRIVEKEAYGLACAGNDRGVLLHEVAPFADQ
jgi:hypothetical protein